MKEELDVGDEGRGTPPDYSGEYRFLFVVDSLKLLTSKITTKSLICYSLQVETINTRPI